MAAIPLGASEMEFCGREMLWGQEVVILRKIIYILHTCDGEEVLVEDFLRIILNYPLTCSTRLTSDENQISFGGCF